MATVGDKLFAKDSPMKPIIILPPNTMHADDIKRLRENGLCVVVCKNPAAVKFLDPIPSAAQRGKIEQAAIQLSRVLLNPQDWGDNTAWNHSDIANEYVALLISGTPLDSHDTQQEHDQKVFDKAKDEELRRLATEEARAERAAEKEAKAQRLKDAAAKAAPKPTPEVKP